MRLLSVFRMSALSLLLLAACASLYAQQDPSQAPTSDPVADAARKARADQKNAPKPKKVFTNDDIPSAPPPSATSSSGAAKGNTTTDSQGQDDSVADNDPKSETYWRKRFKKLHDKIDQSEKELDILQRELNKDQVQYYSDPQKALMQQNNRSDINDKTAKIDAKKKEIDNLKQQLSDLEDELRKAGGNPGWAR